MKIYTKDELINELIKIKKMGWIKNARKGNAGGIGNTLEDLLGIEENNLPIPNCKEWELKCQRMKTSSLTTLFHSEPSPRAIKFVPQVLLLKYSWAHQKAGSKYPKTEMSFRQTISGNSRSDRGFTVIIDKANKKVLISFDSKAVSDKHSDWLKSVEKRIGLSELSPQPYWGFDDLFHKAGTKLLNCFYIRADRKKENGQEYFYYQDISMLEIFTLERFLNALDKGYVYVDFDSRTGHNHGTKFRMKKDKLTELYEKVTKIE
jgi:hypothetical protein